MKLIKMQKKGLIGKKSKEKGGNREKNERIEGARLRRRSMNEKQMSLHDRQI